MWALQYEHIPTNNLYCGCKMNWTAASWVALCN